ncbi:CAAX amino terminal protease [Parasponia andersonii]|uniref:CAAX amino terminal protease n=1 Tax=Parasponia andersonii TaxID=3476 RepID=A0A2P5C7P7_PARAD|nr:CAAX amino terminal protease [Parasponia andersonii]
MELPLMYLNHSSTASFSGGVGLCSRRLCDFPAGARRRSKRPGFSDEGKVQFRPVRASTEQRSGEAMDAGGREGESRRGFTSSAMEVTTLDSFKDTEFPVWDKIGAVVRLSYGIGIYGAMALAGRFICSMTGIDCMGGFHPSLDAILEGLGYAAPPIMALLFILDCQLSVLGSATPSMWHCSAKDEVVKLSPHARAIRDVEDEELRSFFYGMSPWQFILVVAASSVGEELFYRAAVQGALAEIFLRGTDLIPDARGMASLTGVLPPFVPFAQAFAAVMTAALTGSLYYVAASPKDPAYVVAPVLSSRTGREDLKKLFAAWYKRRQMKKIYSPLLEGLLALYLGFEWIQTDNILAPIITHGIYSAVILGHGLWKIHDHRRRLRQRIQQLKSEGKNSSKL